MAEENLRLYKLQKGDKLIFILFFWIFSLLLILSSEDMGEKWIYGLYTVMVFVGNAVLVVYFIVFRWLKQLNTRKHYLLLILKTILFTVFLLAFQGLVYYYFIEVTPDEEGVTLGDFINVSIIILLLSSILLGIIMLKKGVGSQIQMLKIENLQKTYELKNLKKQIDPHFLFNNLNTLDAFIETDVGKAKPYIQRLAKLYQYLIRTQDEDTVNLEEEMNFANDYIYLIKERFGENYQFNIINKRTKKEERLIPPCAIQTVFENIVKHNNASRGKPIITKIIVEDEQMVISNNIRSKEEPVVSFGVGLSNLQSRYQILCNLPLIVEVDENYTITLPLILKINDHKYERYNN
ncbi:histidine kinase [Aureispira sp. CCB-E]|uniref:sensor histidine kinase n=1 Tax=Aureispira sp. CCB-E TaxID=3051121 RepID=UPI0028695106|nr:histidine kinase [Aureispira sp. CCB-E]WMX13116.1 histidine kinase [Aureispira sp. CCB-E]